MRRRQTADAWLGGVQEWFRHNCGELLVSAHRGRDDADRPALAVTLHPVSESLEIVALGDNRIEVSAITSTTGPGYHVYICELLDRLSSEFGLTWDPSDGSGDSGDEARYFVTRDLEALNRAMLAWLGAVARLMLERIDEGSGWAISKGLHEPDYQHDGLLWTPLGPRHRLWLEEVARDPHHGIDLFPWWHAGTGPSYCLGRALSLMWTQVRWRAPITDEEKALLKTVLDLLERAHSVDAGLAYPWMEWEELAGYAGRPGSAPARIAAQGAERREAPLIGYRRRPVRVSLPAGWSIEIPGSFAEVWNPDSWQGFDDRRAVYVSSMSVAPRGGGPPPSADDLVAGLSSLKGPDVIQHTEDGLIARATFRNGDEGGIHLQGASAVAGSVATCTITIDDSDRTWALDVWRSIRKRETSKPTELSQP